MVGALHECGDRGHEAFANLHLALAAERHVEVAVGQRRVNVFREPLEAAEVPFLQALHALVGKLGLADTLEHELKRINGALRGGRVGVIECDIVLGKPRARAARLFAS